MSFPYSKRPTSLFDVTATPAAPAAPQAESLVYEQFFGLTEKAFSLTADSRFVFESPSYLAARESLMAGIRRRDGLHVLTGQIGTGKTTLCRAVLEGLGRNTYSSLVPDPFASREDLLKMLLIDFGVWSIQEVTTGTLHQASRTELGYLLSEFLESLPRDTFVVVMIDEAQNLSLPLIEETRLLSDTFGATGRLQIVFIGQPELHAKLKSPEMRQVDQRVCGYHRLEPMNRDAVYGYIGHRLKAAGGRDGLTLFPPEVIDVLHARTGGVPRLINRICDRALMLAYQHRALQVTREFLEAALTDVGAATLSPTWDSIMFAEPAAVAAPAPAIEEEPPVVAAAEDPVAPALAAPVPAEPPTVLRFAPEPRGTLGVEIFDPMPPVADQEVFKSELEHWVAQDLGDTVEPSVPGGREVRNTIRSVPLQERKPRSSGSSRRGLHGDTYGQRLMRRWLKRAAVAVGVIGLVNAMLIAGTLAPAVLSGYELPQTPPAPARVLPSALSAKTIAGDLDADAGPAVAALAATSTTEWLVAVGLFGDRDRADRLVDTLTQAGLPAMQRLVTRRGEPLQQIVLGPFFSRADASADLRRLQQYGGFADAAVVDGSRDPFAP